MFKKLYSYCKILPDVKHQNPLNVTFWFESLIFIFQSALQLRLPGSNIQHAMFVIKYGVSSVYVAFDNITLILKFNFFNAMTGLYMLLWDCQMFSVNQLFCHNLYPIRGYESDQIYWRWWSFTGRWRNQKTSSGR